MILNLPWPDSRLSSNGRGDRRALTAIRRQAREDGILCALMGAYRLPARPLALTLEFRPPDRRRRDLDGLLSAMKSSIDGVFQALDLDDSLIHRITLELGDLEPGGSVRMTLEPL